MSSLLAGQRGLPDHLKQSVLLLTFKEPVPERMVGEFYRINLKPVHLDGGESDYYMADFWQQEWSQAPMRCRLCGGSCEALSQDSYICSNKRCEGSTRPVVRAKRGVVKCHVFPEFLVADEILTFEDGTTRKIPLVDRVLLALDRRYEERVLVQVKRAAFALAEMLFMPLKE